MKKIGKLLPAFAFLIGALLFHCVTAQAYIDPAASSYIIQIVAGVVISCGVVVSIFFKKISLFFKRKKMERLEKKLTRQGENKEKEQ